MDLTKYDGVIERGGTEYGLIYFEDGEAKSGSRLVPTNPQRIDTGNEFETRAESGDYSAQGDFSGGMGQQKFHKPGRDPSKGLFIQGFQIKEESLKHHFAWEQVAARGFTQFAVVNGRLFAIDPFDNTNLYSTADLVTWTSEAIGGAGRVLVAGGTDLFVGTLTGIRKRDAAGTWTDENSAIGGASKILFTRGRLIWYNTNTRVLSEEVPGQPETTIDTIPSGWNCEALFTAGGFIYAVLRSSSQEQSMVMHYTYDESSASVSPAGWTEFPPGVQLYSGFAFINVILLGGAVPTVEGAASNVTDGIVFKAFPQETGALVYEVLAQARNGGLTQSQVRSIAGLEDGAALEWMTGPSDLADTGKQVALYDAARDSFSLLPRFEASTNSSGQAIIRFRGRIVAGGETATYALDPDVFTAQATFISSLFNWNKSSPKNWASFDIETEPLPAGTSVSLYYSTEHPENDQWTLIGTMDDTDDLGATSKRFNLASPVTTPGIWLKIVSNASPDGSVAPEIKSYTARSDDEPGTIEWRETRYILLADQMRKDPLAEPVTLDPRARRSALKNLAHKWVTLTEPDGTYVTRMVDFFDYEPAQPIIDETSGDTPEEVYVVGVVFQGRKSA